MPRWKDLKKYLDNSGWVKYKSSDHDYYKKINNDGSYQFCKVSRGSKEISKSLFQHILKHELKISKEDFNKGLK